MAKFITKSLGEITFLMAKGIAPKYAEKMSDSTVVVLNQKCNRDFSISLQQSRLNDCRKKAVPPEKMLCKYDVLINSTGTGTAGRVAQLFDLPEPMTLDGHMILIRPTDEIDPIYYGYAVKSHQTEIELLAEGSTGQTEINRKRLESEIMISFPENITVQKQIGELLYQIDQKIWNNTEINDNLLEQAVTLFNQLIRGQQKNGCIGDYCCVKSGFAFKSSWWQDSGIRVIKIGSINQDNLDINTCSFVSEDKISLASDFTVKGGDLLIAMTGATIGKFSLVPNTNDILLVNQRVGKFFLGENPIDKLPFIYCQLKQDEIYNEIINRGQGSAQPNISASDIISIACVIPESSIIDSFNTTTRPLFELIINNQLENRQLEVLRDNLLPKLMTGEFDISDIKF